MIQKEATAEVFWTAFKALSKKEQQAVLDRLLRDEVFMEDLMDVALIEDARAEPGEDITLDAYIEYRKQRS